MPMPLHAGLRDESGATSIEYSMIASLVAIAVLAAVAAIGGNLAPIFAGLADVL